MSVTRRHSLFGLLVLPGCSVLPDRPFIEIRRYPLSPARPADAPRRQGREAVLVRDMRAGPGLDSRGLRSIRNDGTLAVAPYAEWAAPPADAAEAAMREWLRASGLFAGVALPGSRIAAPLVLESELVALEQDSPRTARAAISALLVEETGLAGVRLRGQFVARGTAAVQGEGQGGGQGRGQAASAQAMSEALGAALASLETELARILSTTAPR